MVEAVNQGEMQLRYCMNGAGRGEFPSRDGYYLKITINVELHTISMEGSVLVGPGRTLVRHCCIANTAHYHSRYKTCL